MSSLCNLFLFCHCQAPAPLFHELYLLQCSFCQDSKTGRVPQVCIWLCPAFFPSGHCHACLSNCHHIFTVVKQEKKSCLIHRCLWSFLLLTNSFFGLLGISLAIKCLWTVIKDRNPPLHKAPGGLSASPLQGRCRGQAPFHLDPDDNETGNPHPTIPECYSFAWARNSCSTFLFPSWPGLNSENPLGKEETRQQAKTRTDYEYEFGYCGLPLSENNYK